MTDKELLEQFQTLTGAIEKMSEQMATKEDFCQFETRISTKIEEAAKRIDTLFGGYELAREKKTAS